MKDCDIIYFWNAITPLPKMLRVKVHQAIKHFKLNRSDIKRFVLMCANINRLFKEREYTLKQMVTYFYLFDYSKY